MAAIVDVSEKGPFEDKMVTDKCISAYDRQIHQQKGDGPTFICYNIHAKQA